MFCLLKTYLGKVCPLPKASLLFLLGTIFSLQSLSAQTPSVTLIPAIFNSYEFIDADVATNATQISVLNMEYSYSGFSIADESYIELDLTNSWFGDDTNTEVSVHIDHVHRRVTISLTRTDNQTVSGSGLVLSVKEIYVILDDVHNKTAPVELEAKFYPNPSQDWLHIELPKDAKIQVLDLNGKVHLQQELTQGTHKLSVSSLPVGTYILKIRSESGMRSERIVIQ